MIAFNGYANQYKSAPISVKRGERIRMYVLNAGPSKWSAFHVIGTVFDRTVARGNAVGRHSQTMNFAPSQGGWAEFTLAQEGNFPFVTHSFGDMVRGAAGVLHTAGAPMPKAPAPAAPAAAPADAGAGSAPRRHLDAERDEDRQRRLDRRGGQGQVHRQERRRDGPRDRRPAHQHAGRQAADERGAGRRDRPASARSSDLAAGATKTLTLNLKPGHYALICNIAGHYMAGMYADLTVR